MYPNGGASWNSREAGDLRAGACTNAVKCTDCHNPHQASATPADTLSAAKDDPVHIAACTGCHRQLATKKAAAEHSHHASEHGVTCLDCHMPRMVHGLSDMVRSHRISSPGDPAMIGAGWPNACNLCHLDRSVTWTVEELKATWGATIALPADAKLPAGPAGEAWLGDSKPMVRKIAADAYSRSPLGKAALARVLPILADQSPPNRMFGLVAVERILGRPLPLDAYTPWASPAERDAQIARLRTQ
jgi:hypothetical protein